MTGVPSSGTLKAAWSEADALEDAILQHRVYRRLLECGIEQTLKDRSLINAVRKGPHGIDLCRLLLEYDASPDYCDGASIVSAAKAYDMASLDLLADAVISERTFNAGIRGILESHAWTCPEGLKVVQFLVGRGVDQQELHLAFCAAARLFSHEALELLEDWVNLEVAATRAFAEVTSAGKEWLSPDNLAIIDHLIQWGATGEPVDLALIDAVDALCLGEDLDDLVDTLLPYTDINVLNGSPVASAAKYGKVDILEKLLSEGVANAETLSVALAVAITTEHEEKLTLSIIDVIMRNEHGKLDAKLVPEGYYPPLFACLQGYPQSVKLAKRLCEIGCSLEHTVLFPTYDDEDLADEEVPVLPWALYQPKKLIASAVIEMLIEAKGECLTFIPSDYICIADLYSESKLHCKTLPSHTFDTGC